MFRVLHYARHSIMKNIFFLNNAKLMHPFASGERDSKHECVPKADILNTRGTLICVNKQRNSIPHEHLL